MLQACIPFTSILNIGTSFSTSTLQHIAPPLNDAPRPSRPPRRPPTQEIADDLPPPPPQPEQAIQVQSPSSRPSRRPPTQELTDSLSPTSAPEEPLVKSPPIRSTRRPPTQEMSLPSAASAEVPVGMLFVVHGDLIFTMNSQSLTPALAIIDFGCVVGGAKDPFGGSTKDPFGASAFPAGGAPDAGGSGDAGGSISLNGPLEGYIKSKNWKVYAEKISTNNHISKFVFLPSSITLISPHRSEMKPSKGSKLSSTQQMVSFSRCSSV